MKLKLLAYSKCTRVSENLSISLAKTVLRSPDTLNGQADKTTSHLGTPAARNTATDRGKFNYYSMISERMYYCNSFHEYRMMPIELCISSGRFGIPDTCFINVALINYL